jgi:hypothetical protein
MHGCVGDSRSGLQALAIKVRLTPACVSDRIQVEFPCLHGIWERMFERAKIEGTGVTGGTGKLMLLAYRGQANHVEMKVNRGC